MFYLISRPRFSMHAFVTFFQLCTPSKQYYCYHNTHSASMHLVKTSSTLLAWGYDDFLNQTCLIKPVLAEDKHSALKIELRDGVSEAGMMALGALARSLGQENTPWRATSGVPAPAQQKQSKLSMWHVSKVPNCLLLSPSFFSSSHSTAVTGCRVLSPWITLVDPMLNDCPRVSAGKQPYLHHNPYFASFTLYSFVTMVIGLFLGQMCPILLQEGHYFAEFCLDPN